MAGIRVGTSGWSYEHWRGVFYPSGLPAAKRLPYYSTRFPTVEIDSTFYNLPSEKSVRNWREEVPEGFAFAAKGSRLITHYHRLTNVAEATDAFGNRLSLLGSALEVILWQLPPKLSADPALLDRFLSGLPRRRHAVEFRNRTWLTDETYAVLRKHNAANVQVSSDVMPVDLTVTADFVYVRFHGTSGYHGAYHKPALEPWRAFLAEQAEAGKDGYVYFNNDFEGHAPRDAARLTEMLGKHAHRLEQTSPVEVAAGSKTATAAKR